MAKSFHLLVNLLKTLGTSLICTIALSSILVLSGFSMILTEVSAQNPDPIGDFYCWDQISDAAPFQTGTAVQVSDQFGDYTFNLFDPLEFCEAADKDLQPFGVIGDPDFPTPFNEQHYTTYAVSDLTVPTNMVNIGIVNFPAYQELRGVQIGLVKELWVPNDKDVGGNTNGFIASEDKQKHFLCYGLPGTFANLGATIRMDTKNFGFAEVTVLNPFLFCNPAIKTHNGVFGVLPKLEHLTCFNISVTTSPDITALLSVRDQLTADSIAGNIAINVQTMTDDKVCFESGKVDVPLAGSLIPINTASLLLAGTQMIGAWLVPALVAATGIAIVIARKY